MKSLSEAREYLGIQNSTLYTWMKVAKVKSVKQSTKQGTRAYLDDEAIAILEQLKLHLESGGNFDSWGQSEMVTASPESIEYAEMSEMADSPELELEELPKHDPIAELMENAKRQAAGVIIAQNVLARQYIDDPDSLPPEYQALINKSKPVPKSIDPLQYAQSLTGMNLNFLNPQENPENLEENLAEMPESPEENQAVMEPLAA